MLALVSTLIAALTVSASPDAPASPFDVHGWVDASWAYNVNGPSSGSNFEPGLGSTAKRSDTFQLETATLDLVRAPDPVGAHLTLSFGDAMDVMRAAEPTVWQYVYQATLSWNAPIGRGLLIEAGIYPCQSGFEGFFSKDDWNYTRGWLAELSPYYQAGVKVTYAFSDSLSAQLQLINGWSVIADNNTAKTLATALTWSGSRGSLGFNTLIGPELAGDDSHWRFFGDVVGTLAVTGALSLATELDAGLQQQPVGGTGGWQGAALYARYAFDSHVALAARGELFHDPEAIVGPVGQTLGEGTLTLELRPDPHLIFKLEGRYDHSTTALFDANGPPRRQELLAVAGAVAQF